VTNYKLNDHEILVRLLAWGNKFLSSSKCPDLKWGLPSLLLNSYWTLLIREQSSRSVVLRIQLPSSVELSNDCSYTSTPPLALKASTGTNLPFVLLSFHFTFVTNLLLNFLRHTVRANSVGHSLTLSHRRHVAPVYFI